MNIFPMTSNDLEACLKLASQLGYPARIEEFRRRFETIFNIESHRLFVYRLDGEVRGWIHFEVVSDLIEPQKLEIKALIVDESFRSQKIGTQLVQKAEDWAHFLKLNTVYLSCNITRKLSHDFYLKAGYSIQKTSHFFEKEI